jgi:peptidoglycan/LPS O-acetylase OafA/YrhL
VLPSARLEALTPGASDASPRLPHIPTLDGLRGVAVALVLVYHVTIYGGFQPLTVLDRGVRALTLSGWTGVDLFFVLSGFLITRILLHAKGGPYFFRHFYIRRALRIFPLYYATLAVFFLLGPLLVTGGEEFQEVLAKQAWYWTHTLNIDIALHGWHRFLALGHFWTLAIEEQFYLVWPLLVFLLGRRALAGVLVAVIVTALGIRMWLVLSDQLLAALMLTPARMDTLACGSLLALAESGAGGLARWRRPALAFGLGAAAVLGAAIVRYGGLFDGDPVVATAGFLLLAGFYGSTLVIAATAPVQGLLGRTLTAPWLTLLGRHAYALYVFHHPIVIFAGQVVTVDELPTVYGSRLPALGLYSLVIGGASLAAALVSWRLLERPFLNLKNRFPYIPAARRSDTQDVASRQASALPGPGAL